jgi:hypothetical protein
MLTTGALLISIALLTLMAVGPVFRRSDPPRWTTRRWIGELVTLAFVSTLAIGLGYAGAGAISAYQQGPSVADLALLGGVLVAAAVIGRKLRARVRREAVAAVAPLIVAGDPVAPVAGRLAANAAAPSATDAPPRAA